MAGIQNAGQAGQNILLLCLWIPFVKTQHRVAPTLPGITRQCEEHIRDRKHDHSFKKYHLFRVSRFVKQVDFQVICKQRRYTAHWMHMGRSSEKGRPFHAALFLGMLLWLLLLWVYPWWEVNPLQPSGHTNITSHFWPCLYNLLWLHFSCLVTELSVSPTEEVSFLRAGTSCSFIFAPHSSSAVEEYSSTSTAPAWKNKESLQGCCGR